MAVFHPHAFLCPPPLLSLLQKACGLLEHEKRPKIGQLKPAPKITWGVKLVEVNGQRYAILPESTPENPLGIMDGRPTVRLSSE